MGPLQGIKVVEFGGIGPGPFCAMMLADMGVEVIRIDRKEASGDPVAAQAGQSAAEAAVLHRGRRSVAIDLKVPGATEAALALIEQADGLIEGFRPGVMERLGLSPDTCAARNPRLVYGRITGWGQDGPLAQAAGHDINYIALVGALHAIGPAGGRPVPPLNLIGDFGGGGMLLAFGMVCALLEARKSGRGQVIDAAMIDGAATLLAHFCSLRATGECNDERGTNRLDGGAPDYNTYECADGKWIAIGALEPKFYDVLLELTGIDDPELARRASPEAPGRGTEQHRGDRDTWPVQKEKLASVFRTRTQTEWCNLLEGTDACFAPVLDIEEAARHPHNQARQFLIEHEGILQPAPAPRFKRTPGQIQAPPPKPGQHTREVLEDWGFSPDAIAKLVSDGVI